MADNRMGGMSGTESRGGSQGAPGNLADQAQSAMRSAADTASDMLDTAREQGQRYLRQGSQAMGELDTTAMVGLFVAGAIGFGLAWLIFGQSSSGQDMTRRMSESSERYGQGSRRHH